MHAGPQPSLRSTQRGPEIYQWIKIRWLGNTGLQNTFCVRIYVWLNVQEGVGTNVMFIFYYTCGNIHHVTIGLYAHLCTN